VVIAAEFYGVSFKQICNWITRFDACGIGGLEDIPGCGRHSFLSVEQKDELYLDFQKSPSDFGFNSSTWTAALFG